MMEFKVPDNVYKIINELHRNNYEAFAVGGCVRDKLLGREPKDWDITTSAMPEEVKSIFDRTVDTGIKHGTVTVLLEQAQYEVTTYRIDGEYVEELNDNSRLRGSSNQRIHILKNQFESKYNDYITSSSNQIQNFTTTDGIVSVGIHRKSF